LRVSSYSVKFRTTGPSGIYDLTQALYDSVRESGVSEGVAWISAKGATPVLLIVPKHAVADVVKCMEAFIPAVPPVPWMHGNAYAHLRSTVFSTLKAVPVVGGEPALPEGYGLFFIETRPVHNHEREVIIQVHGP